LVARGCHQDHCRGARVCCSGPQNHGTSGWWQEAVIKTTAGGGESAVQVLKTTGLPVGGKRLSSRSLPGGESAVQVIKTTGLWSSEAFLDTTAGDAPAVQVLKTTWLPVGGKRLSSIPLPTASLYMSSKPRDFGVARLSSIPRPATSLLFRSSKPLDFQLVPGGCPQYHCQRRACSGHQNRRTLE
jgi:hypothetical protein